MSRAFLIVMDSAGAGGAPDAAEFFNGSHPDTGANTLAHIAAAYDWTLGPTTRPYGKNQRLRQVVRDCLTDGVARGDVDPSVDPEVVVDALMAIYAWTYRLAAWEDADASTLSAVFDRQVGLIADGFRPRTPGVG